jgi:hypothetical protein
MLVLSVYKPSEAMSANKSAPPHLATGRGVTAVGPMGFEPTTS